MTSSPSVGKATQLPFAFGWTTQKMISTRGKACWFSHRFQKHTRACLQFCWRSGAYHCHLPTGGYCTGLPSKRLMLSPLGMRLKQTYCVFKQHWTFHIIALKDAWMPPVQHVSHALNPVQKAFCRVVRIPILMWLQICQPQMDFPCL